MGLSRAPNEIDFANEQINQPIGMWGFALQLTD